ncbi:MAG: methyltransferase [Actinobacteria bacterium]|nr:methyltransferase [Actinomycetota bacterium]
MSATDPAGPGPLIERLFAWVDTTAIMAGAELALFDYLADGPRTAAEVAAAVGADEARVGRLLRDLTGTGVVTSAGGARFALGAGGEFLCSDVPGSVRGMYRMIKGPIVRGLMAGEMAVRSQTTAFDEVMGAPFFDYLALHPEEATIFNGSMVAFGQAIGTPPIHAYDFSGIRKLVDVGGGLGQLAMEVLRTYPEVEAVVYDAPAVIRETLAEIERQGLADRCTAVAGDFFKSVPAGGDCYTLRWIVHDWNDVRATTILRCCREAIDPAGKLLLVEVVMPAVDGPHPAKTLDWAMLASISGQERTEAEYGVLLEQAGFRLTQVIPSASPMSVVEAVPA